MAPIWHQGNNTHTYKAAVSFMGPNATARTANTTWKDIGYHDLDQFAVLPRNERAEGGEVLWTWKNNTDRPYCAIDGDWKAFNGLGDGFDIVSMDVVFLGDSEPPKSSNPNATPKPWTGVDVLLALE